MEGGVTESQSGRPGSVAVRELRWCGGSEHVGLG